MTREEMLNKLLQSYASSYDIEEALDVPEMPMLAARAHFHVEESQYMLVKSAVMYETHSDEYVWFYSVPHLTDQLCEQCIRYAWDQGLPLAKHDGKQMVTRIAAIFICDSMDEAAQKRIEKCALYKSFQFSLKGWAECHAVAADLGKESAVSNRFGRETAKHLKNLMLPPQRRGGNRLIGFLTGRR